LFFSFARADKDFATQLAAELENRAQVQRAPLDEADACVVILSKATEQPPIGLTREWSVILDRKWTERKFRVFSVKRHRNTVLPAFLKGAESMDVKVFQGPPSKAAGDIVGEIQPSDGRRKK